VPAYFAPCLPAPLQEIVSWMGWTPWKISYASNYFDKLHHLAIQLIKAGKAFVCHQVRGGGVGAGFWGLNFGL